MKRRTYTITDFDETIAVNFDREAYVISSIDLGSIDANLSSYVGAGQNGQTITARSYGTRDVAIEGHILAENAASMKSRKAILQKIIVPTADFWLIIDSKYKILLTAQSTIEYSKKWYRNNELLTSFSIDAVANNPFFQSLEPISANITGWIKDFHFPYTNPVGSTFTFGHRSESKIVDLRNESEVETGMVIEFKAIGGTIVNPYLEDVNGKERLKVNCTLAANEVLSINTGFGEKSIVNKTKNKNYLHLLDLSSDWLQMPVGLSSFKYGYDDTSTGTLECNISYTPKLIEV